MGEIDLRAQNEIALRKRDMADKMEYSVGGGTAHARALRGGALLKEGMQPLGRCASSNIYSQGRRANYSFL